MTIFDNTANFDQKILTGSGVSTSGCGLKQSRQFPITSNCKWLHVKSTTYSFYTYFTFDLFSVRKWKGVACIGRPPTLRRVCSHEVSLFLSRSKIFLMTSHALMFGVVVVKIAPSVARSRESVKKWAEAPTTSCFTKLRARLLYKFKEIQHGVFYVSFFSMNEELRRVLLTRTIRTVFQ